MKNFFSGLKLGLFLQAGSIGPICLLLFQLPMMTSLSIAMLALLGVVVADAMYIFLAAMAITPFIDKIKQSSIVLNVILKLFLIVLGGLFIYASIENVSAVLHIETEEAFVSLFVLTLLNPLTIVAFMGILAVKTSDKKLSKVGLFAFSSGVLTATPIFLGSVVLVGSTLGMFLPSYVVRGLNCLVGVVLIYWGARGFAKGSATSL